MTLFRYIYNGSVLISLFIVIIRNMLSGPFKIENESIFPKANLLNQNSKTQISKSVLLYLSPSDILINLNKITNNTAV